MVNANPAELRSQLANYGYAVRPVGKWPARASYWKLMKLFDDETGKETQQWIEFTNMPSDPYHMPRLLKKGFRLNKPGELQTTHPGVQVAPSSTSQLLVQAQAQTPVAEEVAPVEPKAGKKPSARLICPQCDKVLRTAKGVKLHKAMAHRAPVSGPAQ